MIELMKQLKSCNCHFIRCIKPNEQKVKRVIDQFMTLNQIRYLGVLDSLKVRKNAYPIRRMFKNFYSEYEAMTNGKPIYQLEKDPNTNFRDLSLSLI